MQGSLKDKFVAVSTWAVNNRIEMFIWSCLASHAFFLIWFLILQVWPCVILNIISAGFYFYMAVIRRTYSETDMVVVYFEILVFAVLSSIIVGPGCGYNMFILGMISILFLFAPSKGNWLYLFMFIGFVLLALSQILAIAPIITEFDHIREAYAPYATPTWFINFTIVAVIVIVSTFLFSRNSSENLVRLAKLSNTDELTGLGNRRHMEDRLKAMDEGYALAMLDIDDFKMVNDTYGHDMGDIVLKKVASVMRANVRAVDEVARWGGEEFVICLPGCPIDPAVRIMDNVREDIAEIVFEEMPELHITATIGVAVASGRPYGDVARAADEAMYRGKRSGKNRVVAA